MQESKTQEWCTWLELLRSGIHGERTSKLQLVGSPLLAAVTQAATSQHDDATRLAALEFLIEYVTIAKRSRCPRLYRARHMTTWPSNNVCRCTNDDCRELRNTVTANREVFAQSVHGCRQAGPAYLSAVARCDASPMCPVRIPRHLRHADQARQRTCALAGCCQMSSSISRQHQRLRRNKHSMLVS